MPAAAAAARGSAPSSITTMYAPSIPRLAAERSGAASGASIETGDGSAHAASARSEEAARDIRIDFICNPFCSGGGPALDDKGSTRRNPAFSHRKGECTNPEKGAPPQGERRARGASGGYSVLL